ncbi:tRNA (N(6)-L-threonylcarbamoyladenosine(37)-C(2))-methylthiotransferase [Candidatus Woesearchaeota archaeon]|nr:tRNA (N(6)-L-threonylcarbamoyladenosine(37)-C(2))-methylthiotransferase [Candidatus Woesearchaeota archaeon]
MKVYLKTYGCQANIADSEAIAGILKQDNYELTDNEEEADTIIVNTCSVKNSSQSKELHYIREKAKTKKVVVGGCLTKTLDIRKYAPEITAVFDTNSILKIPEVLQKEEDHFSNVKENRLTAPVIRKDKSIGIISIGEGCLNSCTFCATKLARGNLRSYRIGDIKRSVEKAVKEECKKIYLTSQDNGCYGFDIKTSLPELLNELTTIEGNYIIRVGMMNPWHLTKILTELIEAYKSEKIMKFLHIPVQSGSEKILKHMKRIHTVENYKTAVKEFRKIFPEISIATDVIVGYPFEAEEDFQLTYNLIKETKPEVLNISKFSSRPGTKASELKQLSSEMIKERSVRLYSLYQEYRKNNCSIT